MTYRLHISSPEVEPEKQVLNYFSMNKKTLEMADYFETEKNNSILGLHVFKNQSYFCFCLNQGSQTQIHRRATFQRKSTQRAAVYNKKLLRAAQMHLAGHMFETSGLNEGCQ